MNTIHPHIHPDTKIACYADDIALWHTHRDIAVSEKALNKTLKGIAAWAKDLKLTINADKTNYCIFSTDRWHRGTFNADIKIEDYNIKRVIFPTYLGVTLDSELHFTKHIEQTTIKALRKLNILRKLCGTTWGSRPRTLKNAYSSIIRPVLKYAAPIWAPASVSSKQKLDSIQYRASKIIIGAVSSTNIEKLKGSVVSLLLSVGETLPLLSSPTNYDVTRKITSPPEYSMSGHIRRDLKDQCYNLMRILESK
ncbi:reverse transcriptase domain-containing protein [Trichonephila clavipes]|nr:reverse transcriptase domain-containing protein [Trichonephila clavipes]